MIGIEGKGVNLEWKYKAGFDISIIFAALKLSTVRLREKPYLSENQSGGLARNFVNQQPQQKHAITNLC